MGNQSPSSWEEQYEPVEQIDSNRWKIKLLTNPIKFYELVSIYTNQQEVTIRERLRFRQRDKNIYLQKLINNYNKQQSSLCSDSLHIDLVFRQSQPNLCHHCRYRLMKKQPFRSQQIMHVIRNVAMGLQYLRTIGEKHGLIDLDNIIVNDDVYIKDPILVENQNEGIYRHRKTIKGFPSPQKLREYYDMVIGCEQHTWDLFSLGMVALQMFYLDVNLHQAYSTKHHAYNNCQINYGFINKLIMEIKDFRLREWISILLHPQEKNRRNIYHFFNDYQYNSKRLKLLRQDPFKIRPQEELIEPIQPFQEHIPKNINFHRQSNNLIPVSHTPRLAAQNLNGSSFIRQSINWRQVSEPLPPASSQPKYTYINQSFNYNTQINYKPTETILNEPMNLASLTQSLAQLSNNLKSLIEAEELELSQRDKANKIQQNINFLTQKNIKKTKGLLAKRTSLYTQKLVPTIPQVQEDHSNITQSQYVIEEYQIGTKYQGFKKNGKRNGNGKFYYSEGSFYEGQWKDNKMNGLGTLTYPNGRIAYKGEWQNDEFEGRGILYNNQQNSTENKLDWSDLSQMNSLWTLYQGDMHRGKKQGYGRIVFTNEDYYQGQFMYDQIDGEGTFYSGDGKNISGKWIKGILVQMYQSV